MQLLVILNVIVSHNGVIHRPLESSAILVGPSLVDTIPFVTFNYGMNYVKGFAFNTTWFPVAVLAVTPDTVFTVSDIGDEFRYTLNAKILDTPKNCPPAQVSKFVASGGETGKSASLFLLQTGQVYTISYTNSEIVCSYEQSKSWRDTIDWVSPWGGSVNNNESPLFFSFARWNGCNWYTLPYAVGGSTKVKAVSKCPNPQNNTETVNLADGYSDPGLVHGGGEFFVLKTRLYLVNGDTSAQFVSDMLGKHVRTSRASDDNYLAGKILLVNSNGSMSIVSRGFRHPWTAVVHNNNVFIADVGYLTCEEISIFTGERANFGWPLFEGKTVQYPFASISHQDEPFIFPIVTDCRYRSDFFKLGKTWDHSVMILLAIIVLILGSIQIGFKWHSKSRKAILLQATWFLAVALLFFPFFFSLSGSDPATILRHRSWIAIVYVVVAGSFLFVPWCASGKYSSAVVCVAGILLLVLLPAIIFTFPRLWAWAAAPYLGIIFALSAVGCGFYLCIFLQQIKYTQVQGGTSLML